MNIFEIHAEKPIDYIMTGIRNTPFTELKGELPISGYKLMLVSKGTLFITEPDIQYQVQEGEYLVMPPSLYSSILTRNNARGDCSFFWMHFNSEALCLKTLPNKNHQRYPYPVQDTILCIPQHGKLPEPGKAVFMMEHLLKCAFNQHLMYSRYYATAILCEIHNQYYCSSPFSVNIRKNQMETYYDIINYINTNLEKNIKVEEIAHAMNYNARYLSGLFQSISGLSLKQYIMNRKINAAKERLANPRNSIMRIALSLGFSDSQSFSKCFKKNTCLTPSQYRNKILKKTI